MGTFEGKVRKVGTSFGVLIPKDVAQQAHVREGQKIQVSIIRKDPKAIRSFFGRAKGASRFEREHVEREL